MVDPSEPMVSPGSFGETSAEQPFPKPEAPQYLLSLWPSTQAGRLPFLSQGAGLSGGGVHGQPLQTSSQPQRASHVCALAPQRWPIPSVWEPAAGSQGPARVGLGRTAAGTRSDFLCATTHRSWVSGVRPKSAPSCHG